MGVRKSGASLSCGLRREHVLGHNFDSHDHCPPYVILARCRRVLSASDEALRHRPHQRDTLNAQYVVVVPVVRYTTLHFGPSRREVIEGKCGLSVLSYLCRGNSTGLCRPA